MSVVFVSFNLFQHFKSCWLNKSDASSFTNNFRRFFSKFVFKVYNKMVFLDLCQDRFLPPSTVPEWICVMLTRDRPYIWAVRHRGPPRYLYPRREARREARLHPHHATLHPPVHVMALKGQCSMSCSYLVTKTFYHHRSTSLVKKPRWSPEQAVIRRGEFFVMQVALAPTAYNL